MAFQNQPSMTLFLKKNFLLFFFLLLHEYLVLQWFHVMFHWQIESIIWGGKEKTRYNVYFYGTHQSSILRSSSLFHYDTYAKQIVEKWGRKPKFHDALQELERDMVEKMTYLNQLRTSSSTPDPWCQGFNSACESLVSAFDGANRSQIKSKSHRKSRHSRAYGDVIEDDIEGELTEESRRLGYEVMMILKFCIFKKNCRYVCFFAKVDKCNM